jgi:glycine/D-amino acid oxidase-like deaminating enzyme
VVVGAGVFGASLARHCALAGWDVVLVERVAPGHVRAGSGDESRIIRCCHGADAWHTRSARRAWALWHEIDPGLVVDCGVAWLARPRRRLGGRGRGPSCAPRGSRASASTRAELFPSIAVDDVRFTLFEPEAGILRARDAVKVLAAQAVAAGAELVLPRRAPTAPRYCSTTAGA